MSLINVLWCSLGDSRRSSSQIADDKRLRCTARRRIVIKYRTAKWSEETPMPPNVTKLTRCLLPSVKSQNSSDHVRSKTQSAIWNFAGSDDVVGIVDNLSIDYSSVKFCISDFHRHDAVLCIFAVGKCLSVRLSVRHNQVLCQNSLTYRRKSFNTWQPQYSTFLILIGVMNFRRNNH